MCVEEGEGSTRPFLCASAPGWLTLDAHLVPALWVTLLFLGAGQLVAHNVYPHPALRTLSLSLASGISHPKCFEVLCFLFDFLIILL